MSRLDPAAGPLLVASHNEGKVREFRELLAPFGLAVVSAAEKGLDEPEETGTSFEENARLKSLAAAKASGLVALSDDSGLCVEALGGDPGIYSARWAGASKDFAQAMRNVEEKLQAAGATTPDRRSASFVSVLSLAWPDGTTREFRGEILGTIVWPPRGTLGFGYDPFFQPEGMDKTFGELSSDEKHGWKPGDATALSHRARAFKLFAEAMLGEPGTG
ncbi:non-canonical purine NTP pyrophosphatase [Aureimonas endophytica]|uniref:dITP/XTP pyrophosphatase n=1 Tax=Aureimonas endophytica TaxID=2027858 RepID=A0A917E6A5_9HYPH|nr:RdgB/HAM1 family non-canonical purine NTP pyrophosphatase [Aureimonas endophytica]GGE08919.1 non-canonical purine NTP pyrophosphatase [Aureimonas endophytica]